MDRDNNSTSMRAISPSPPPPPPSPPPPLPVWCARSKKSPPPSSPVRQKKFLYLFSLSRLIFLSRIYSFVPDGVSEVDWHVNCPLWWWIYVFFSLFLDPRSLSTINSLLPRHSCIFPSSLYLIKMFCFPDFFLSRSWVSVNFLLYRSIFNFFVFFGLKQFSKKYQAKPPSAERRQQGFFYREACYTRRVIWLGLVWLVGFSTARLQWRPLTRKDWRTLHP